MNVLHVVLILLALVAFALAAVSVNIGRAQMGWVGLAIIALDWLIFGIGKVSG